MLISYQLDLPLSEEEIKCIKKAMYNRGFGETSEDMDLTPIRDEELRSMVASYVDAENDEELSDSPDEYDHRKAARARKFAIGRILDQFLDNGRVADIFA